MEAHNHNLDITNDPRYVDMLRRIEALEKTVAELQSATK